MKTILVLTDFSDKSKNAADVAWKIAEQVQANLLLYNVCQIPNAKAVVADSSGRYYDNYSIYNEAAALNLQAFAGQLIRKNWDESAAFNPTVRCTHDVGVLKEKIKGVQRREEIWMVVMGDRSDGGNFQKLIKGSDSNEVIDRAQCPVLLVPEKYNWKSIRRIVFAMDVFSDTDLQALSFVSSLAEPFRADISVAHINTDELGEDVDFDQDRIEKAIKDNVGYDAITYTEIHADEVPKTLLQYAFNVNSDIITLVHKKYPFFEELFHVSTTKKILDYHLLPMLVFPAGYK